MTDKPGNNSDQEPNAADVPAVGTPEYEEVYQQALKALDEKDEAAAKPPATTTPPAVDEPPGKGDAEIPGAVQERIDTLQLQLDSAVKSQQDTRTWAQGIVQRFRDFQGKMQEGGGDKPLLLNDLEGLEEAIEHVITTKGVGQPADDGLDYPGDGAPVQEYTPEQWIGIVHTTIPDMDELMKDADLLKTVEGAKDKMGADWKNPLLAIKAMSDIRSEHLHGKKVADAVKTAIEQYGRTQRRAGDMELEGGGGGPGDSATLPASDNPEVNDAAHWNNMSAEEFEKRRQKVLNS